MTAEDERVDEIAAHLGSHHGVQRWRELHPDAAENAHAAEHEHPCGHAAEDLSVVAEVAEAARPGPSPAAARFRDSVAADLAWVAETVESLRYFLRADWSDACGAGGYVLPLRLLADRLTETIAKAAVLQFAATGEREPPTAWLDALDERDSARRVAVNADQYALGLERSLAQVEAELAERTSALAGADAVVERLRTDMSALRAAQRKAAKAAAASAAKDG